MFVFLIYNCPSLKNKQTNEKKERKGKKKLKKEGGFFQTKKG
jgi:hypothetical protein